MLDGNDGRHDFDFLHGQWRIVSRKLTQRLQGSDAWETFEATGECHPVLGGMGNVDSFHPVSGPAVGYEGMSVRIFDGASGLWTIYWADNAHGEIFPPVSGRFENGVAEFDGNDIEGGQPVQVIFHWDRITPKSAHWDQAFSTDGGVTWETNWHMDFTRDE